MKRRNVLVVFAIIAISMMAISCTSYAELEAFNTYKMDKDKEIQSLTQEIELAQKGIASLTSAIEQVQEENALVKEEIAAIQNEFNRTYSQIEDLVILAGYETGEDFINLARDITYVNNNIKELNEKIEILREAMATFVNN